MQRPVEEPPPSSLSADRYGIILKGLSEAIIPERTDQPAVFIDLDFFWSNSVFIHLRQYVELVRMLDLLRADSSAVEMC